MLTHTYLLAVLSIKRFLLVVPTKGVVIKFDRYREEANLRGV